MTLFTLGLVLASAVIHATWNLWAKEIGAQRSGALLWLLTAISAIVFAPVALVLASGSGWRPSPTALLWIGGSAVIHVAYFVLLLRGYRRGDLSLVYPVARGTGPMLAVVGAILWFGERPTLLSLSGAVLIGLGILVLTWHPDPASHARRIPAIRYGLATGVAIAVYTLWDGWGVTRIGVPPVLYYWAGEVVRAVLFTPVALADRAGVATLWRTHRARVLGIAALSPLSYILILFAMRDGAVSHIAPAREVSILIGAWLGGHVLGEGDRPRRLAAAAAFAAGVVALAFA